MCLMCEYYIDSCEHPECVAKADERNTYTPYYRTTKTSGTPMYLWRGVGRPICPDMVTRHAPECACLIGDQYEECDCDV